MKYLDWRRIGRMTQGGYYAVLPYLAYLAIFMLGYDASPTILLGWVVLLVYQILFLGLFAAEVTPFRPAARWLFVLPPLLIGGRQALAQGSVWNFFLEEMLLEAIALVLVFVLQLFFARDRVGRTAWADLGIIPLLVGGILGFGMWDFGRVWWEINVLTRRPDWPAIAMAAAAFAVALFNYWRALSAVRNGRMTIEEVFPDDGRGIALILGQVVLWVALGFIARALTG